MDISLIVALLVLGAAVGFGAGLLGIGGGMLLVPFMTMLLTARGISSDYIVHMAVATSLATILFTSLSSVREHHKHDAVLWPVVLRLTPGILIGSWFGPWLGAHMSSATLALLFAVFVIFSGTQMLLNRKPAAKRELPKTPGMFAAGFVIGTLGGLVGAGGGFVSVPFMTWCNVNIRKAVGTSAALGFPVALSGTLSNIYNGMNAEGLPAGSIGFVYAPALVVIVVASVLTAPWGARMAQRLPVQTLKKVFAGMLYALAGYMLWRAFH